MTHQSKFADLRENEEIPIDSFDENAPIDGNNTDINQTSQETEASNQLSNQEKQKK